jgi:hypothetical protein
MGAQKKFKNDYPAESETQQSSPQDNLEDKRLIEAYIKKIQKLMQEDPEMQKKAALILEKMINKGSK